MSTKADELRDLYLDVADEATITESQEQDRNRDPLDATDEAIENEVADYQRQDGLDEALEGSEGAESASA